jgi:hypothetical protein
VNSAENIPIKCVIVALVVGAHVVIFVDLVYAEFASANWRWKEKSPAL